MSEKLVSVQLVPFEFDNQQVRVIQSEDGEPRFVAKDVAEALGYVWKGQSGSLGHVPEEWKGVNPVPTPSGTQVMATLTSQGVYFFLARSDKPLAVGLLTEVFEKAGSAMEVVKALQDFELPADLPDMFVYAIRECETGRIKLGISRDPEARLRQLQTGNSQRLELVAYRRAENRFHDESMAHRLNSGHHIRGEWFGPSASLDGPLGEQRLAGGVL